MRHGARTIQVGANIHREVVDMPMSSKMKFTRRPLLQVCAALILACSSFAGWALAQESAAHDRIYVVTHVDIVPPNTADGTKLVRIAAKTKVLCASKPERRFRASTTSRSSKCGKTRKHSTNTLPPRTPKNSAGNSTPCWAAPTTNDCT